MTPPLQYQTATDAELYDRLRDIGLSPTDAKRHVELRRSEGEGITADAQEATVNPDLGGMASARIGLGQGLLVSDGALAGGAAGTALGGPPGAILGMLLGGYLGQKSAKPATELLSSAPASDVRTQWDATVRGNPELYIAGNLTGGLAGGLVANRVATMGNALASGTARRAILEARAAAVSPEGDVASAIEPNADVPTSAERAAMQLTGKPLAYVRQQFAAAAARGTPEASPADVEPISPGPPGSAKLQSIPGTSGRGFSAEGPATPPAPPDVTRDPIAQQLAGMGKGKTLPYYPRGGSAEQAVPPSPVSSMMSSDVLTQARQIVNNEGVMGARRVMIQAGSSPQLQAAIRQILAGMTP